MLDKLRRRVDWIFWAPFSGNEKGFCLYCEKEWRSISTKSNSDKIALSKNGMLVIESRLQSCRIMPLHTKNT